MIHGIVYKCRLVRENYFHDSQKQNILANFFSNISQKSWLFVTWQRLLQGEENSLACLNNLILQIMIRITCRQIK